EASRGLPCREIPEEGARTRGITDREPRGGRRRLAFVVVIPRRAVGGAAEPRRRGQQDFDPGVLRFLADLDLARTPGDRVLHDAGNHSSRLRQIVWNVGNEVGTLDWLDKEGVGKSVNVNPMQRPHAFGPGTREFLALASGELKAGAAAVRGSDLEPGGV